MANKSSRMILAFVFIVVGFSILELLRRSILPFTSDFFTIWSWSMLVTSMFVFAICIVLSFDIKKTIVAFLFLLLVSIIFFIPIPYEIQPLAWGFWLFLLASIMWAYKKYKSRR